MAETKTSMPALAWPGLASPGSVAGFGLPVSPPTWPQGPLGVQADINLGYWNDFSFLVYQRSPMQVTRGRQNQSATLSPSQCTMVLNNRDSRFTVRNPVGAWYGQITQNSPFRLSVPNTLTGNFNYLRIEDDQLSYASCPDSASLQITGTLDVRIDLAPSGYGGGAPQFPAFSLAPTSLSLMGKSGTLGESWALFLNPDGTLVLYWNDSGSQATATSTVPIPNLGRIALRAVLNTSGQTVTFYTAADMAGTWNQLGAVIDTGATALSAVAGQGIQVGYTNNPGVTGQVYEVRIYSGATLVADPLFAQGAGTRSFTDNQGNTWGIYGTAEISDRLYRYHGELSSLPRAADNTGTDVYSQATAFGLMQRLQQQQNPIQSAMYRAYVITPPPQLAGYWSMEDGTLATSLGSGLPNGIPMAFTGKPTLASSSSFVCSAPLPVTNSASFTAVIPENAGVTWTANVVRFLMAIPSSGESGAVIAQVYTTGTTKQILLAFDTPNQLDLTGLDGNGNQLWTTTAGTFGVNGELLRVSIELNPTTAQVVTVLPGEDGLVWSTSFSGTIGAVTKVVLNPGVAAGFPASLTQTALGHLSVQGFQDSVFDLAQPLNAWSGELAANRFARLCSEEGFSCRIYGFPDTSAPMGYQTQETFANLLQEIEYTDQGMQFEPRTVLGLGYLTRAGLYNLAVTATADYATAQIDAAFGPATDNQITLNDVTLTNADGSSARQVLESGPMSVNEPPAGIGRLDTQVTVNTAEDSQLASLANWMLWVRSINDDRYPVIPFNMARTETPDTIPLLDCGSYLQLTATPLWVPPPPVRQLTAGFAETLGPAGIWQINCNGIPEAPYEVAVAGTAHADTGGSTLTAAISTTATSMSVTTAAGNAPWTTSAGDFPFDILCDGERMTVTNITSASSPQTFTVTRSVNGIVKTHAAGVSLALYQTPVAAQ